MIQNKYNILWVFILTASLLGAFLLVKSAYANSLELPDYAFTKPGIKEAYSYAKLNQVNLEGLPCNCGCMTDAANHGGRLHSRGLIDCFMQGDLNSGGKWDKHASECGLCYEDALLAKSQYDKGKSKYEIVEILKEKYSKQIISNKTVWGNSDDN